MTNRKISIPKLTEPVVIKISENRTSQDWGHALLRFQNCLEDDAKCKLLRELSQIPVLATSFGQGTPGREILDDINHLITSGSCLSKMATQVRDDLVTKYAVFHRCLACDRDFKDLGVFFTHLQGHIKNLTGTRRTTKCRQLDEMAQIQAKLLTIEVKNGRLGDPKASYPSFFFGNKVPGVDNEIEVCLKSKTLDGPPKVIQRDMGDSNSLMGHSIGSLSGMKMKSSNVSNIGNVSGSQFHSFQVQYPKSTKMMEPSNVSNIGNGSGRKMDLSKLSNIKNVSGITMGSEDVSVANSTKQLPLLYSGKAPVTNKTVVARLGNKRKAMGTIPQETMTKAPRIQLENGNVSCSQFPSFEVQYPKSTKMVEPFHMSNSGNVCVEKMEASNMSNIGNGLGRKMDLPDLSNIKNLSGIRMGTDDLSVPNGTKHLPENKPVVTGLGTKRKATGSISLETMTKTPRMQFETPHSSNDPIFSSTLKGQTPTSASSGKSLALDSSSGKLVKKVEGKGRGEIRFYGTVDEIKEMSKTFDNISKERSLQSGSKETKRETLQYLYNLHYCRDSSDVKGDDSAQSSQSIPNGDEQSSQSPQSEPPKRKPKITKSPEFDNTVRADRKHFLANWKCLDHYGTAFNEHGKMCSGDIAVTRAEGIIGYTCKERTFTCQKCGWIYKLMPSPRLRGRGASDFVASLAYRCSGGMVEHFSRYNEHLGIRLPDDSSFQNGKFKKKLFHEVVAKRADQVRAANRDKALKRLGGKKLRLNIDAAHNTRRNSPNSTLTAQDPDTNRIIFTENAHRREEPSSQRHEAHAAQNMADKMAANGWEPEVVCSDAGSKATPTLKRKFDELIAQDDDWHDLSKLDGYFKDSFKHIPSCDDKPVLLRKHVYTCLKICKITPEEYKIPKKLEEATTKFRKLFLQAANHYQGVSSKGQDAVFHQDCHESSRCKSSYYGLNEDAITSEDASLLRTAIAGTKFYKRPERYILNMNTSAVESCHRVQNIYRDKGTKYSPEEYDCRINLAVLHSDEQCAGKYEDGKLVNGVEFTNGPIGHVKKVKATRNFINDIDDDYFNEIVKSDG